ncbi:MAG: branched-chain amino acid ABC transporter permease [Sporichthyaceae bacterium]
MDSVTALEFNSATFGPSIVSGVTNAGLTGLIAVALVLSFRISRTIAFVHGGILLAGALMFWYYTAESTTLGEDLLAGGGLEVAGGSRPEYGKWPVMIALMLLGAAVAAFYGFIVTSSKLATYPRVTLTNFSLALMLIIVGLIFTFNSSSSEFAESPFGEGGFKVFGIDEKVTRHEAITLLILAVVVAGFTVLLQRTRFGVYTRAVADNVEASKLVGVPIGQVGTVVYAISGAIAALAGVLLAQSIGTETTGILFVFLRALIVCVLGAFGSIPLALAGAVLIAVIDSMLKADVFGTVDAGIREIVVASILFSAVIAIDRFGKKGSSVLAH